jgi:hypothetical protein
MATLYAQAASPSTRPPSIITVNDGKTWDTINSHYTDTTTITTTTTTTTNMSLSSTGKGILIGMLSAFGSAALVAIILAFVYFFRYTNRGRIFLDTIGRPGEFDDEQAFLRDEEDALEDMDDVQRAEYLRAKGESFFFFFFLFLPCFLLPPSSLPPSSVPPSLPHPSPSPPFIANFRVFPSFRHGKPSRIRPDRHLAIAISRNPGKGCAGVGIRARIGNCKLLCRGPYRD